MIEGALTPKLEAILQRRLVRKVSRAGAEVLIQWNGAVIEDATWEDLEAMKQKFPNLVGKIF